MGRNRRAPPEQPNPNCPRLNVSTPDCCHFKTALEKGKQLHFEIRLTRTPVEIYYDSRNYKSRDT